MNWLILPFGIAGLELRNSLALIQANSVSQFALSELINSD